MISDWPFSKEIYQSMMTSSNGNNFRITGHLCGEFTGNWRGQWAFMFSSICVWINGWVNNREAGDLRRYRVHYDVTLITLVHNQIMQETNCMYMYSYFLVIVITVVIVIFVVDGMFFWLSFYHTYNDFITVTQ